MKQLMQAIPGQRTPGHGGRGLYEGRTSPTEEDTNTIMSGLAMEDKTLQQCTSHLLETLEDKGIWQILEGSLKKSKAQFVIFLLPHQKILTNRGQWRM